MNLKNRLKEVEKEMENAKTKIASQIISKMKTEPNSILESDQGLSYLTLTLGISQKYHRDLIAEFQNQNSGRSSRVITSNSFGFMRNYLLRKNHTTKKKDIWKDWEEFLSNNVSEDDRDDKDLAELRDIVEAACSLEVVYMEDLNLELQLWYCNIATRSGSDSIIEILKKHKTKIIYDLCDLPLRYFLYKIKDKIEASWPLKLIDISDLNDFYIISLLRQISLEEKGDLNLICVRNGKENPKDKKELHLIINLLKYEGSVLIEIIYPILKLNFK